MKLYWGTTGGMFVTFMLGLENAYKLAITNDGKYYIAIVVQALIFGILTTVFVNQLKEKNES